MKKLSLILILQLFLITSYTNTTIMLDTASINSKLEQMLTDSLHDQLILDNDKINREFHMLPDSYSWQPCASHVSAFAYMINKHFQSYWLHREKVASQHIFLNELNQTIKELQQRIKTSLPLGTGNNTWGHSN